MITEAQLAALEALAGPDAGGPWERREAIRLLVAEVRRLRRGDFTPDEFQALCHHRDERPGCTREEFEAGCREYQGKLFGVASMRDKPTPAQIREVLAALQDCDQWAEAHKGLCLYCRSAMPCYCQRDD